MVKSSPLKIVAIVAFVANLGSHLLGSFDVVYTLKSFVGIDFIQSVGDESEVRFLLAELLYVILNYATIIGFVIAVKPPASATGPILPPQYSNPYDAPPPPPPGPNSQR